MSNARSCQACGALLSRYNPGQQCSSCMSASHDRDGVVPQWMWDSAPLRRALADMDLA